MPSVTCKAEILRTTLNTAMDRVGTLPARQAVKVFPSDWHKIETQMRGAADEIDKLTELLNGRDDFIVKQGLWHDFCDQLPK